VRAAFFDYCLGCPFSPPTPQGAEIGNSGTSLRLRFKGCARQPSGHPERRIGLTYSERSARVATRPESQAAPSHIINLPRRLSPFSYDSADWWLRPVSGVCRNAFPSHCVLGRVAGAAASATPPPLSSFVSRCSCHQSPWNLSIVSSSRRLSIHGQDTLSCSILFSSLGCEYPKRRVSSHPFCSHPEATDLRQIYDLRLLLGWACEPPSWACEYVLKRLSLLLSLPAPLPCMM
jgi:hypothetical protein